MFVACGQLKNAGYKTIYSVLFQLCLKAFIHSWGKMEERLIVIITEWSDYKGLFFLFFEFTKFATMNRHFCNKKKIYYKKKYFQSSLLVQKGLGCLRGRSMSWEDHDRNQNDVPSYMA